MSGKRMLVVLGAAGTGRYIAATVERLAGWEIAGFLDDDLSKVPETLLGYPLLGRLADWPAIPEAYRFVTSLYGPKRNGSFCERLESLGIPDQRWASIVDPSAVILRSAKLGPGAIVGPGCILEPGVVLGRRCALLGNVYIGHDTQLGDHVACANSVSLAGKIAIGRASYIGANATIREEIRVGIDATIGMGSVVVRNVADRETVAGNPARPLVRYGE